MTAEDAVNVFKEQFCGLEAYCEIHRDGLCLTDGCEVWWAIKALEQYKADVQPVRHGHWIKDRLIITNGGTNGVRRCSECKSYFQDAGYGFYYCPSCGARMDGAT